MQRRSYSECMTEEGAELRLLWFTAAECHMGAHPHGELCDHLQALQGCSESDGEICQAADKVMNAVGSDELDAAWTELRDACLSTLTAFNQRRPCAVSEHSHNERLMVRGHRKQCPFRTSHMPRPSPRS